MKTTRFTSGKPAELLSDQYENAGDQRQNTGKNPDPESS